MSEARHQTALTTAIQPTCPLVCRPAIIDSSVPNTTTTAADVASKPASRRRSSHSRTGGTGPSVADPGERVGGLSTQSASPDSTHPAPTTHSATAVDSATASSVPTAGPMM